MFNFLFLVSIVWISTVYGEPCPSCYNAKLPDQNMFCRADFVFKVKITSQTSDSANDFKEYRFRMAHMGGYKLPQKREKYNKGVLRTGNHPFLQCGVDLVRGKEYIVSGMIVDEYLSLDLCNSTRVAEDEVTSSQLEYFHTEYTNNCKCIVTTDSSDDAVNTCYVSVNDLPCVEKHSLCQKDYKGTAMCNWRPFNTSICDPKGIGFMASQYKKTAAGNSASNSAKTGKK